MSYSFDGRFSVSAKPLREVIRRGSSILEGRGILFMETVWPLSEAGDGLTLAALEPVAAESIDNVVAMTAGWRGLSLEWYSPDFGEVYLRVFTARDDAGSLVVYNEGKAAVRARFNDSEAKAELVGMLTEFMQDLDVSMCTYGDKSGGDYQPPTTSDIEDMLDPSVKWPKDLAISNVHSLPQRLLAKLRADEELVGWTIDDRVIVSRI